MDPSEVESHFAKVVDQVDLRWHMLVEQSFSPFSFLKAEPSIIQEFNQLHQKRQEIWRQPPLFMPSSIHLKHARYRHPECLTFEHSATDPSYNCSSIQIGRRRFFALEGPLQMHLPSFFNLLSRWPVGHLVCLTNAVDDMGLPKCYPYWEGRMIRNQKNLFLQFENKLLPYYFWPQWEDDHGVAPQQLISAVDQVRKRVDPGKIIAVHCSGGVGRTGTFIAALCLLDEIDTLIAKNTTPEKIEVNIAKLFFYLNFYRPYLVSKGIQYLTLYKTVEKYLLDKKS